MKQIIYKIESIQRRKHLPDIVFFTCVFSVICYFITTTYFKKYSYVLYGKGILSNYIFSKLPEPKLFVSPCSKDIHLIHTENGYLVSQNVESFSQDEIFFCDKSLKNLITESGECNGTYYLWLGNLESDSYNCLSKKILSYSSGILRFTDGDFVVTDKVIFADGVGFHEMKDFFGETLFTPKFISDDFIFPQLFGIKFPQRPNCIQHSPMNMEPDIEWVAKYLNLTI